jgi:hypothetical protein
MGNKKPNEKKGVLSTYHPSLVACSRVLVHLGCMYGMVVGCEYSNA